MSAVASAPRLADEEYLALPDHDRFELVDGQLVELNTSKESSWVGGESFGLLRECVKGSNLGYVWPADNLYRCFPSDPGKIRKPDVSFVRRERIGWDEPDERIVTLVPDLVAEVVSPNDLAYDADQKIQDYLGAGVRLLWVVHPRLRTVYVYRADGSITGRGERAQLSAEHVVPGFASPVSALFPSTTTPPSESPAGANP